LVHYIIPTEKNNFRAKLISKPFLFAFMLVTVIFNFGVGLKIPAVAQTSDKGININTLLNAHNKERQNLGVSELELNSLLSTSAQQKAETMLSLNCWDHYCPKEKSPWEYFKETGYEYVFAGENLAEGFYDIDNLMKAWMNSSSHRENLLKSEYLEVGFGIAYGNYQGNDNNIIIVAHFGAQKQMVKTELSDAGELIIKNPENGTIFNISDIKIDGQVKGLDAVYIVKDGVFNGVANVNSGIFTYDLTGLTDGDHQIYALSFVENGDKRQSNIVSFKINSKSAVPVQKVEGLEEASLLGLNLTPSQKNLVNLSFILFVAALFLIDLIVLSKTDALKRKKSYSHFNLVIFIAVAFIIISGGYAGHIGVGLGS
jgi:hypothetical protein